MQMFQFDPADYAQQYLEKGYVHIRGGLTRPFLQTLIQQAEASLVARKLKDFAIGDKQQALYQFPTEDGYDQTLDMTAVVAGLDRKSLALSERHFKSYELTAIPDPPPHKDRFASEVSLGFSIRVTPGSTLVLYPEDYLAINQFNSSGELNASLGSENRPVDYLKNAKRIEIQDTPGDVIMFRGNRIWHLRAKPAGTTMLYLKLNTYNCDVLGEDKNTTPKRELTAQLAQLPDHQLAHLIPQIGRRVDYFHRRYDRLFNETLGVVLWGEKHFTLDDAELRALQSVDGRRSVLDVARMLGEDVTVPQALARIRRLAQRGVLDLSSVPKAQAPAMQDAEPVAIGK